MTLEEMEEAVRQFVMEPTDGVMIKPKQLIVPLGMFKLARTIIFPHYILKRRKGARGRAMTLKWRRRMNQGGNW